MSSFSGSKLQKKNFLLLNFALPHGPAIQSLIEIISWPPSISPIKVFLTAMHRFGKVGKQGKKKKVAFEFEPPKSSI